MVLRSRDFTGFLIHLNLGRVFQHAFGRVNAACDIQIRRDERDACSRISIECGQRIFGVTDRSGKNRSEDEGGRGPLIFCGMCGALNPASNFYCAACGTTLVDAFHATEGLRVYERPDSASRLVEIVASGTELEVADDPNSPEDFVRVRLEHGRLGYIRMQDVDALAASTATVKGPVSRPAPDINTNATGCISSTAALGAVALVAMVGILMIVIIQRANTYDQGTLALMFCFGIGPLMILTVAFYLYARSREDRLADDEEEALEMARAHPDRHIEE